MKNKHEDEDAVPVEMTSDIDDLDDLDEFDDLDDDEAVDEPGMFDIMMAFAEPLLQNCPEEGMTQVIEIAIFAWNASIVWEDCEPEEAAQNLIAEMPGASELGQEFLSLLTMLIERKRECFPDISRVIVDCNFGEGEEGTEMIFSTAEAPSFQE